MGMRTMKYVKILSAILLLSRLLDPAVAQEHRHDFERRPAWQGEISGFHKHDLERWRGGRWYQGRHEGRLGWWWIVGGTWYFYPSPIYPYPDPYQPPIDPVVPPTGPQYWYYCANPAGYYPYVPQCRIEWQRVPATVSPAPYPAPPGSSR